MPECRVYGGGVCPLTPIPDPLGCSYCERHRAMMRRERRQLLLLGSLGLLAVAVIIAGIVLRFTVGA